MLQLGNETIYDGDKNSCFEFFDMQEKLSVCKKRKKILLRKAPPALVGLESYERCVTRWVSGGMLGVGPSLVFRDLLSWDGSRLGPCAAHRLGMELETLHLGLFRGWWCYGHPSALRFGPATAWSRYSGVTAPHSLPGCFECQTFLSYRLTRACANEHHHKHHKTSHFCRGHRQPRDIVCQCRLTG